MSIILSYNGIEKTISMPCDFSSLKKRFFTEFKEEKHYKYSFFYLGYKNNNIDFKMIRKYIKKNTNPPIIYVYRLNFNFKFITDLTNDSYCDQGLNFNFVIFNSSYDGILYLVYSKENKSILLYDLDNNQKISQFKKAHDYPITYFKHYFDDNKKRDLIISISKEDLNLKLWDINRFICLYNYEYVFDNGVLYSACFLNDNNNIYLVMGNFDKDWDISEPIKIYDLYGNVNKQIYYSKSDIYFIDYIYDNDDSKRYIITGNLGYIKSYDYNLNKLYYKYDDNDVWGHKNIIIYYDEDVAKIIDSSGDGNIRIWNFHKGELINKIKVSDNEILCMSLWDNQYILVSCKDDLMKVISLMNGKIIETLNDDIKENKLNVMSIQNIIHPQYGKCLVTQGYNNGIIKLWKI